MVHLTDYMTSTPDLIYYDYDVEHYTTSCPPNTHNYDVYTKIITERQKEFDNNPAQRRWLKDTPRDCTKYVDLFNFDIEIYLYWNDFRTELYNQRTKTGHIDIDLALNSIL